MQIKSGNNLREVSQAYVKKGSHLREIVAIYTKVGNTLYKVWGKVKEVIKGFVFTKNGDAIKTSDGLFIKCSDQ